MEVSSSNSASPLLPACLRVDMSATFYPQLINRVPIATAPPSSYDSLGPKNAEQGPELLGPTNDQSLLQVV
ncbi:hypothetical protein ACJZ2D_002956 [Fusarium nematophilum]